MRCPQPACPREGHGHWVSTFALFVRKHLSQNTVCCCRTGHAAAAKLCVLLLMQVTCLHVDGESSLVYSGSMDKTIKAWDMYTARCLRTYVDGADWVTGIHVRRDVVWSSSEDGCIRLWKAHPHLDANADDVAALVGEIHVGGAAIKRLEAPDADHLVSGDAGGTLCYWHLKLGFTKDVCLQATARTGVGTVSCIVLPYHSRQVETWKVERRPLRLTPTTRALKPIHLQPGTRAQSARVTTLVGGHLGLEMWDLCPLVSSGSSVRSSSLVRRFDGHLAAITCIAVLDGTLWSGSEDGMLRAWALDTGACLQMYVGHIGPVRSLAVISHTHLEHLRAAESGKPAARSTLSAGGLVCSGGGDVRIWDMDSGDVISVVWQRRVDAMALTGAILVAASDGHVWSTRNMPRVLPSRILPSSLLGSAASSVLRPSVEALSDAHKSSPTSTAALQKHTIAAGIDGGQLKKLLGQT